MRLYYVGDRGAQKVTITTLSNLKDSRICTANFEHRTDISQTCVLNSSCSISSQTTNSSTTTIGIDVTNTTTTAVRTGVTNAATDTISIDVPDRAEKELADRYERRRPHSKSRIRSVAHRCIPLAIRSNNRTLTSFQTISALSPGL